jgi:hypothetical protein
MKENESRDTSDGGSQKSRVLSNIEWFFGFSIVFAGYLFLKGAAKTQAQFVFRIGLFTIGVIGLIVTEVVKRLR